METKIKVNKENFEVNQFINGYYGICEIGKSGENCVFGGDSANEDDYNKDYIEDVFDKWEGDLTYTGDRYGYKID